MHIRLAHAYRKINQIQTAIQHYEQVLQIVKEQEDKEDKISAYLGLGCVSRQQ